MPFALGVLAVAGIHFLVSFFVAFAAGISSSPTLKFLSHFLTFPLPFIPSSFELPGILNWLPWVLVSLCWGFAICYGIRFAMGGFK